MKVYVQRPVKVAGQHVPEGTTLESSEPDEITHLHILIASGAAVVVPDEEDSEPEDGDDKDAK